MAQITHGEVSVTIPDDLPVPTEAGKLRYDRVLASRNGREGAGRLPPMRPTRYARPA